MSEEAKAKMIESRKGKAVGKEHWQWKGENVGYVALHAWIRRHLPKPERCQICNERPPKDVANIATKYLRALPWTADILIETYNRDLKNWQWLCRKCHNYKDGTIHNINAYNEKRKIDYSIIIKCKCGCGGTLPKHYRNHGRIREYIHGHNRRKTS